MRREAPWLVRPAAPDPFEETAKKDQLARVKEWVSPDEWRMLYGVAAGDYATVARHLGMAVGT